MQKWWTIVSILKICLLSANFKNLTLFHLFVVLFFIQNCIKKVQFFGIFITSCTWKCARACESVFLIVLWNHIKRLFDFRLIRFHDILYIMSCFFIFFPIYKNISPVLFIIILYSFTIIINLYGISVWFLFPYFSISYFWVQAI